MSLQNVRMAYGDRLVLDGLSCGFPRGRISVILGGADWGKSTILRLIGRLIHPQAGQWWWMDRISRGCRCRLLGGAAETGDAVSGGALLDSCTVFDLLALAPAAGTDQYAASEIREESTCEYCRK